MPMAWVCVDISHAPEQWSMTTVVPLLAEGLGLEVSSCLCEVSDEVCVLSGGVTNAHLCALSFAGCA